MRVAVLADVVSKAKGTTGTLTPASLSKAIRAFGEDRLGALLRADQMARLKNMSGEGQAGMAANRAEIMADIVAKAKNPQGQLTPQGLGRAIKNYGEDKLAAMFSPEEMARLRDISTLSGSLEKGTRVMNGSQTAFLAQVAGYPAWFVADPINATLALMGNAAASRFIGSRSGQRWLTGGWNPKIPTGKAAIAGIASGQTGQLGEEGRTGP
jgi:hypothetical protein